MNCPACGHHDHNEIDLHSDGFAEGMIECSNCGTLWVNNHGGMDIVKASTHAPEYGFAS